MSFELLKWHISLNSGSVQVQILLPVWKGFAMVIPAGNNARQPLVGQPFHKNHSFHQLLWCLQECHWKRYHPRQFLTDYICTNFYVISRQICKILSALAWAYYLVVSKGFTGDIFNLVPNQMKTFIRCLGVSHFSAQIFIVSIAAALILETFSFLFTLSSHKRYFSEVERSSDTRGRSKILKLMQRIVEKKHDHSK